ncbi:MAG: hypothetical protein ABF636_11325, partial [Acetobacter sp.]
PRPAARGLGDVYPTPGGGRGAALAAHGQHGPDLRGAAPGGQVPRFTAVQAVAMLLGRGSALHASTGAEGQPAFGLGGVWGGGGAGPARAGDPAGFMAGVLQRGLAAPPCPPDYLHATTHAVGLASTAAPMWATPAPTVQAQITVNATGSTARAIGDELEHRMDTLRMQARQANMGQF